MEMAGKHKIRTIVAIFAVVVILIISIAALYLFSQKTTSTSGQIETTKGSNATAWTWTVAKTNGTFLKNDIEILIGNATGFPVQNIPLMNVSGSHGFSYVPHDSGKYISIGDVFALSKDYAPGSEIEIMDFNRTGLDVVLKV